MTSFDDKTDAEVVALYGQVMSELHRRGVVRSGNNPIGDMAKTIIADYYGVTPQPPNNKSFDVLAPDGTKIKVKALRRTKPSRKGLSPLRTLDFDFVASACTELTRSQRRALGASDRRTQPATLLTQIARDVRAPVGTGGQLLQHAWAVARRGAGEIAATVLALDPYDSETAKMWINRWGFHDSAGPGPGGDEHRLWIPLASSS